VKIALFLPILLVFVNACQSADQDGGQATPPPGKKVIELLTTPSVSIELPDQTLHDFGQDYDASLVTQLTQSERYIVNAPVPQNALVARNSPAPSSSPPPAAIWEGSSVPTAALRTEFTGFSFETGNKGEHSFYGFDGKFKTPFNDGTGAKTNEYPLRTTTIEPNYFDRTFDSRGVAPVDSRSGLDLGDGFDINVLFAYVDVKYAQYRAELDLTLHIDAPWAGVNEDRKIQVVGEGYFWDVAGAYEGYSGGIRIARRDAMLIATQTAITASFDAVDRAVTDLPLMARVDEAADGYLYLGTGPNANVPAGVLYAAVDHRDVIMQVVTSDSSGAIAKVVSGDPGLLATGGLVIQVLTKAAPTDPTAQTLTSSRRLDAGGLLVPSVPLTRSQDSVTLPKVDLPASDLSSSGVGAPNWAEATVRSVVGTATLPYRIWRYFNYDQPLNPSADVPGTPSAWAASNKGTAWAKQIGLSTLQDPAPVYSPLIAIVDSGVDYNHPAIHDATWLNPNPTTDDRGRQDTNGWDFISNDARPYDDGYHGTEIASLVLAVAPSAKILPIKVFSPYGITSSSVLYAGITYAVDQGAKVIVCAWSTRLGSDALDMAISYARDHGVLVVTAAGDLGYDLSQIASYPAVLSGKYDNVLTVAAVNAEDQLVQVSEHFSNFGAGYVDIAAPGQDITASSPRNDQVTDTSSGLAAALVAGAVARGLSTGEYPVSDVTSYQEWTKLLKARAKPVTALSPFVQGGLRLSLAPR
jgi:hypothetical protein